MKILLDFFKKRLEDYRKRRDLMHRELNRILGVRAEKPTVASYASPNIKEILERKKLTTEEFSMRLMRETGVVTLPRSAFPSKAGNGYLRLSYTLPIETIKKGLERFNA